MNDRHPAGDSFPADPGAEYSYAAYDTAHHEQSAYGSYGNAAYGTATQEDGWSTDATGAYDLRTAVDAPDAGYYGDDPLYGTLPGGQDPSTGTYPTAAPYAGLDTGAYGNGAYDNGAYGTDAYGYATDAYPTEAYEPHGYATGGYDTTGWDQGGADYAATGLIPHQPGPHEAEHEWPVPADGIAQWDTSALHDGGLDGGFDTGAAPESAHWDGVAYGLPRQAAYDDGSPSFDGSYEGAAYDGSSYEGTAYEATAYGTGSFEAAAWNDGDAYGAPEGAHVPGAGDGSDGAEQDAPAVGFHEQATATFDAYQAPDAHPGEEGTDGGPSDPYEEPVIRVGSEAEPEPGAAVAGPQGRGRRRSPKPRRSALLTVAAPSVAVLGVAGIAAASVLPAGDEESAQAAPDTDDVKVSPANTKLDTQLAGLREAGDDFADRASRTQERIDLKKRQEAERRRKAAEAARREALRPKFALPVEGAGISAYFGQAGINWMSVHTGLDFPVSYGTPVKAATDGTVRTQWNPAYGNMIILTAPDGTETWYCHLSSTRIRTGSVKAGTVIGYSGNSGNSTGPHLHFEVRPGGGSAIDPLAWFRSHGLEPT